MTPEELVGRAPFLYHMAEEGSWPSIERHGLLSTSALLDLFEYAGAEREALESCIRPESVTIKHPVHGTAVIRDNKPLHASALEKCLVDMTPREWCELLNGYCFFWCSLDRVVKLLGAKAYRDKEHVVLTVSTKDLVVMHGSDLRVSRINSGSTLYNPPPRGRATFIPLADANIKPLVELVVPRSIPRITAATVRVQRMKGGEVLETLWERATVGTGT